MLTMFEDDASVLAATRAGSPSYVLKDADGEDIFSPTITRRLTGYVATPGRGRDATSSRASRA